MVSVARTERGTVVVRAGEDSVRLSHPDAVKLLRELVDLLFPFSGFAESGSAIVQDRPAATAEEMCLQPRCGRRAAPGARVCELHAMQFRAEPFR